MNELLYSSTELRLLQRFLQDQHRPGRATPGQARLFHYKLMALVLRDLLDRRVLWHASFEPVMEEMIAAAPGDLFR